MRVARLDDDDASSSSHSGAVEHCQDCVRLASCCCNHADLCASPAKRGTSSSFTCMSA
ncbi:hypothetical protein BJY59DRAFT_47613 [Rhodotorula toruloides]